MGSNSPWCFTRHATEEAHSLDGQGRGGAARPSRFYLRVSQRYILVGVVSAFGVEGSINLFVHHLVRTLFRMAQLKPMLEDLERTDDVVPKVSRGTSRRRIRMFRR
jgi:hypothetical protein